MSLLSQLTVFCVIILVVLYVRIRRAISYQGGVPRFGHPGVIGYIRTAMRWTIDSVGVIEDAREQFNGGPFSIPTLSGPAFLLPPKHMERLRAGPDTVLNQMRAVSEDLQLHYTMDIHLASMNDMYQTRVLRTDVNHALPLLVPELREELVLAIDDAFGPKNGQEFSNVSIFHTLTHTIARISNRVIYGQDLCRNKTFIDAVVTFAETTIIMAPFINWTPASFRPWTYRILSSILGGKKQPLKYIIPHLEKYISERENMGEKKTGLVSEILIDASPDGESVKSLATRFLNLNFGSTHTSSIFCAQALYELAVLSPDQIATIRKEIQDALDNEGGWTKEALDRFFLLDSALREVGRYHGLMYLGLSRFTEVDYQLDDGMYVPPGFKVAVDMKKIHFNPEVYPEPEKCDLFRFAKLRNSEQDDDQVLSKFAFSNVDTNYLPFGAGRHACPGRQFASVLLKLVLAHMLLEYDITLPDGQTERPKNMNFDGANVPDHHACLKFARRKSVV